MRAHPIAWFLATAVVFAAALVGLGADLDAGAPGAPNAASPIAPGAAAEAAIATPEREIDVAAGPAVRVVSPTDANARLAKPRNASAPDTASPPTGRQVLVVDRLGRPQAGVTIGQRAAEVRTGLLRTLTLGATAHDGTFPFPIGSTGLLVAEVPGGCIGERLVTLDEPEPRLVLQSTGALAVLVTDATGRPVADAEVVLAGAGCRQNQRSDVHGRTTFPRVALDGELDLRATAHGRRSVASIVEGRHAGRTVEHIVVLADECAWVRTALLDASGRAIPDTTVRCTFANGSSVRACSDDFGNLCIDLPPAFALEPGTIRCEPLDARGRLHGAAVAITVPPGTGRAHAAPPIRLPPGELKDAPRRAFNFTASGRRPGSRP